jgi:hypothetical protein
MMTDKRMSKIVNEIHTVLLSAMPPSAAASVLAQLKPIIGANDTVIKERLTGKSSASTAIAVDRAVADEQAKAAATWDQQSREWHDKITLAVLNARKLQQRLTRGNIVIEIEEAPVVIQAPPQPTIYPSAEGYPPSGSVPNLQGLVNSAIEETRQKIKVYVIAGPYLDELRLEYA